MVLLACLMLHTPAKAGTVSVGFKLSNASMFSMRQFVYVCGLREEQALKFIIYKCDSALSIIDSSKVSIAKQKLSDFIGTNIDSLHGKLQIELISTDLKGVCLLRIDVELQNIDFIKLLEPGRVNSKNRFGQHSLIVGDKRLDLQRVQSAGSGTYFLKLFLLKAGKGNYEYEELWQQPFTQSDIVHVELLYADERFIYAELTTKKADNYTVEILKLNMTQGFVVSTYSISNDQELYRALRVLALKAGELTLLGQVHTSGAVKIWQCIIDSNGIKEKTKVYSMPLSTTKSNATGAAYYLKFESYNTNSKTVCASVYKEQSEDECKLVQASVTFSMQTKSGQSILSCANFSSTCIGDFYTSTDRLDRNGKLKLEQTVGCKACKQPKYETGPPVALVINEGTEPRYFCVKTDTRKQLKQYYELGVISKNCEKKLLESIGLQENPIELRTAQKTIAVGRQNDKENYTVKIYNW